jgi:chemotaxis protein methyltransferase CheR
VSMTSEVSSSDIDSMCGLVMDLCGVYLDESKAYLLESRLGDLSRREGCANYAELARKARYSNDRALQSAIVDAITTHETLFFRDGSPFEAMKHRVLPDLIDAKAQSTFPRRLRIWSAACSTGQEVYSIAMALQETLSDLQKWDIRIHGTDVSNDSVQKASAGWYAAHEIERGLDPARLHKFFTAENSGWRVRPELRGLASFERRNLLESFRTLGPFDIVFCRNVAIYFVPTARDDLFERIAQAMTPDGCLFVGAQESLTHLGKRFEPHLHCRAAYYRPNLNRPAAAGVGRHA